MNVELVSKTEVNKSYFEDQIENLVESGAITENEKIKFKNISPEQLIIYIARVSSSRDNKLEEHEKLINYLIENAHWSPFEHAYLTFEFTTSRAIGRQEIRHRSKTFQEFSQRYAEVTQFEDFELRERPESNRQSSEHVIATACPSDFEDRGSSYLAGYIETCIIKSARGDNLPPEELSNMFAAQVELSRRVYKVGLKQGVASECARFVLPECTQTVLYSTGNIRSWIHWLELRDDEHAQKEIREIAQEVGEIFQQEYPVISNALEFDYGT